MPGRPTPKWLPYVGYPAFFLFALAFFFHLTLPYDTIKSRLVEEAREAGYQVTMLSLGPSIPFGISAKGVMLSSDKPTASTAAPDAPPAAISLDSVSARPSIFPMGTHLAARAFGGDIDGTVASKPKGVFDLDLHGTALDLARTGLKGWVGLDMEGKLKFDAELSLNTLDLSKTTGTVKISGKEMVLNGGTVNFIDLPKANLGSLDIKLKADGGKANIETFALTGGDIEAKGEGDITLGQRLNSTSVKSKIEFKPNEDWLKKYSFIQTGLSMAGRANSSGFYTANIDGLLVNPRANLAH